MFLTLLAAGGVAACSGASWQHTKAETAQSGYTAPKRVAVVIRATSKAAGVNDARAVLDETVKKALRKSGIAVVDGAERTAAPRLELDIVEWDSGSGVLRALTEVLAGGAKISVHMRLFFAHRAEPALDATVTSTSESGAFTERGLSSIGMSAMVAPEDAGLAIAKAVASGRLD